MFDVCETQHQGRHALHFEMRLKDHVSSGALEHQEDQEEDDQEDQNETTRARVIQSSSELIRDM